MILLVLKAFFCFSKVHQSLDCRISSYQKKDWNDEKLIITDDEEITAHGKRMTILPACLIIITDQIA